VAQLEGLPLPYGDLERSILPARVSDFSPRMLDELGAMGEVVWVGCGSVGSSDGRVALFRRDRVPRLLEPPSLGGQPRVGAPEAEPAAPALSPLALAIVALLEERGACFFPEIEARVRVDGATPEAASQARLEALWQLVWAGIVTNDTFQPLRALGLPRAKNAAGGRRRSGAPLRRAAGRWSLVRALFDASPQRGRGPLEISATERAHARAVALLERHGIVSRDAVELEALVGGFSLVYPVLRQMEEAGKVRRGLFVAGLDGVQFAYAGAVDRLRALRAEPPAESTVVLATADPANPYGWILPWPALRGPGTHPLRRGAGALVTLVDGEPALYLERGGRALFTFGGVESARLERAARALVALLERRSPKSTRIDSIDGELALSSSHAAMLRALGLSFDHKGFFIERRV
jgi:ATP-dependent Lhr-like helicase